MYLLETALAQELRKVPHFAHGWQVREGFNLQERHSAPALHVRLEAAQAAPSAGAGLRLGVTTCVAVVVAHNSHAVQLLDAAFTHLIASLHGLRLEDESGRTWSALQLAQVREAQIVDGLCGCELWFTTQARFNGLPCE